MVEEYWDSIPKACADLFDEEIMGMEPDCEFFVEDESGEKYLLLRWEPKPDDSWTMTGLTFCDNNGARVPLDFKVEGDWVYPTSDGICPSNPQSLQIWWMEETWERNGEVKKRIGHRWWHEKIVGEEDQEALNGTR